MTTRTRTKHGSAWRRIAIAGAPVFALAASILVASPHLAAAGEAASGTPRRCWTPPVGAAEAGLTVTLRVEFDRNGAVIGTPKVIDMPKHPLGPALAASASRALVHCGPYRMPATNYEKWHWIVMKFDPKDL